MKSQRGVARRPRGSLSCEEIIARAFELAAEIDVPHRLILNAENRGSSVARNQIIDYAVGAADADYLLFMDGDIEIVPFSSYAMLRHMENNGRRLGCIGADSFWHSPERARTTPYFFTLQGQRIDTTNLVAWTQYGLFRREVFDVIDLESPDGTICLELVKKLQYANFKFAEVPVHHYHRTYGKSQFFNFRRLSRVVPHVAWLWWKLVVRREHMGRIRARRANVKLKMEN